MEDTLRSHAPSRLLNALHASHVTFHGDEDLLLSFDVNSRLSGMSSPSVFFSAFDTPRRTTFKASLPAFVESSE